MDPYLEGNLWRDVHHNLASKIQKQVTPLIRPKYVARIEKYVVEDDNPEGDSVMFMYPDSSVLLNEPAYAGDEPFAVAVAKKPPLPSPNLFRCCRPLKYASLLSKSGALKTIGS